MEDPYAFDDAADDVMGGDPEQADCAVRVLGLGFRVCLGLRVVGVLGLGLCSAYSRSNLKVGRQVCKHDCESLYIPKYHYCETIEAAFCM